MPVSVPRVVFLDKLDTQTTPSEATVGDQNMPETAGRLNSPRWCPILPRKQNRQKKEDLKPPAPNEQRVDRGPMDYRSHTDDFSCFGMETDTGSLAQSTLAQALYCPAEVSNNTCSYGSSNESNSPDVRTNPGPNPLSGTSRVKRMLNSVVERASRPNLDSPTKTFSQRRSRSVSGLDADTDIGSDSAITYGTRRDDASPGVTSEAESHQDLASNSNSPACSSPGAQTLTTVRREAISEQGQAGRQASTRNRARGQARSRRRVGRVLKEEYFESMPWTRTLVSGPIEPKWNKHKIYCQICKCDVSIRAKGPKEILRHYSTERHSRKDQRWRYKQLTIEDPLTKRLRYQVRGRDGKVLSIYLLQLELPLFIESELVDIGDKLPFFDEAMAGSDYMASSPQNSARCKSLSLDTSCLCHTTFRSYVFSGNRLVQPSITSNFQRH